VLDQGKLHSCKQCGRPSTLQGNQGLYIAFSRHQHHQTNATQRNATTAQVTYLGLNWDRIGQAGRQAMAPSVTLVVYMGHGVQAAAEVAPVAAENVPAGHCRREKRGTVRWCHRAG
jgi:hypothetical protein